MRERRKCGASEARELRAPCLQQSCWELRWRCGCDPGSRLLWADWGEVVVGMLLNMHLFGLSGPNESHSEVT